MAEAKQEILNNEDKTQILAALTLLEKSLERGITACKKDGKLAIGTVMQDELDKVVAVKARVRKI